MHMSYISKLMVVILFFMCITSCSEEKKLKENNISFETIEKEESYNLLDDGNNPNCNLQIKFSFPEQYTDSATLSKLQRKFIATYFGDSYTKLPPRDAVNKYIQDYINTYKELEPEFEAEIEKGKDSGAWYSYYEMSSNDIKFNKNDILSFVVSTEAYTGGAHGSHTYNNYALNTNNGEQIKESEIFHENYQDLLSKMIVDKICEANDIKDPKELENIGYFSVEDIVPNNNFFVDELGITYTYNEYEIAAYVIGPVHVRFTYEELAPLLRPESPISHLAFN